MIRWAGFRGSWRSSARVCHELAFRKLFLPAISPARFDGSRHLHTQQCGPLALDCLKSVADSLLNVSWFFGVIWQLLLCRPRCDVIHIHFNHSIWCRLIAICLRTPRVPVVISRNTGLGGVFERLALSCLHFDIRDLVERAAISHADAVVTLTDGDAQQIAESARIDPRRVVVVPDGIDEADFQSPNEADVAAFRARHQIPVETKIVSFVGRISSEKGWEDFAPLLPILAKARLFLLVCGDGRDRSKLETALRATKFENWCITGFLSPKDVKTALHLTTVLALPSRREAFGSVLLEAMAAGVPAVAYAVGGILEVAGPESAIALVDPGNIASFADRVVDLCSMNSERNDLIARGRARVKAFDITSTVNKTLALYDSLLLRDGRVPNGEACSVSDRVGGDI